MEEDKALTWAKDHKKQIVKEYLNRYEYPSSDSPNVIFMAGAPGAGKTEFARRLIPQLATPPLHIDMDEIAERIEDYKPKIAHLFRKGATVILERLYDKAIDGHIDILMDGTFSHTKALQNVERALTRGYKARLYFISPDPLTAWQKTQEREIVEKRSIDPERFADSYFQLLDNLKLAHDTFGEKLPISIVLKDSGNRFLDIIENLRTVDGYLKPTLTKAELLDKIKV